MIRFLGEGFHLLEHWYVVKINFLPPNDPSEVQIIRFSEVSTRKYFDHVTTFEINSDPVRIVENRETPSAKLLFLP